MAHTSPGRGSATERILVVHADAAVRHAIRLPLARAGHEVVDAAGAAGALGIAAAGGIAVAIVDAAARVGDGRSLVAVLADDDASDTAIVALVTLGDDEGALVAVDDGADDHVGLPIDSADLLVRVRASLRGSRRRAALEHAALRRIAVAVAREASPENVFDQVARELARVHRVAGGAVVRFDDGEAAFVGCWARRPGSWPARDLTVPLTSPLPLTEIVRAAGPSARADDFRAFAGAVPWVLDGKTFRGSVAAPVSVGERLWGAVVVATDRDEPFPPETESRLAGFAELVSLAIGNAEVRAELTWRAAVDPLTGLVNRRVFDDRLAEEVARARRHGRPLALAVLDLDRFKQVNDLHGHVAGDEVLREAALRLSARAREGDVIARLGGEEFGWLMPETDAMEAWRATERARAAVAAAPFAQVGSVTVSGGVCDLTRAEGALDLYRRADAALYWAKRHGRDVVFLYSAETMAAMSEEERAAELRRAQALQSIHILARSVDAKDPSTRGHSERVAALAAAIGAALGWERARIALLHEAALVHDVGKIAVPDAILFAPHRLGAAEMARVRTHPALGAEMLSDVLNPEQATWIRAHHERWDGGGYPDGLAAEEIPDGARILHLASAWDVMTTGRPYVDPVPPAAALAECARLAGAQFWERAVTALVTLWEDGALDADAPAPPSAATPPR